MRSGTGWVHATALDKLGLDKLGLDELGLDAPLDDLEPLRELVGGARVVALGESAHRVPEFYQVRHRLMRFLVERCGFTVYALEAPFTEGHALDAWVAGGDGQVEEVAAAGITLSLGALPEVHDVLGWMRERNSSGRHEPVRCVGTDLPGCVGSPLPALHAVHQHLSRSDPALLPLVERAVAIADRFHDSSPLAVLRNYPTVPQPERDELTAALSRLQAAVQRTAHEQQRRGHRGEHATAAHHLRGAVLVDQLHRAIPIEGFESASTFRDLYMAESVCRLLDAAPGRRVVLAAHNWHIQKQPVHALTPAGAHLVAELGDDYRAVALTCGHDDEAAEYGLPDDATWTLADLRAAGATETPARFDAIAHVPRATVPPAFTPN